METIKFRIFNKKIKSYIDIHSSAIMIDELNDLNDNLRVEQFTGLHDKNGKEIYEGDWCCAKFMTKNDNKVIQGLIIMDEFMWCIDCTGNLGDDIFSINRIHDVEVIGNINENQELLDKNLAD